MNDITVESSADKNDHLMIKVIESGNIEALERFISLREREESRQFAMAFDAHFSEMQSEFTAVERSKQGFGYKYAPIEALQKQYGPIIARHGFSYTWTEEALEKGKRCTMRISGHGAARYNSFDIPELTATKQMNAVQAAGAMSTYGRRYTFQAGFGVVTDEGEDSDAQVDHDPTKYTADAQKLQACEDLEALKVAWTEVYRKHQQDSYAVKILTSVYSEMKGKLNG